jgi:hypothetical protein
MINHTESQKAMILEYLLTGARFTTLEAIQKFNCLKASNRISELKKQGWKIESVRVDLPSNKRVAQYYMPF